MCCRMQIVFSDLKSMKLQIDAIVSKSEALKLESTSEEYNRQLTDNGLYADLFAKVDKKVQISVCDL